MSDSAVAERVRQELAKVLDPEIRRPITELGMVNNIEVTEKDLTITIDLTISGCPMRQTIDEDVKAAGRKASPERNVHVKFGVMTPEQREDLRKKLRGGQGTPVIPFAQPENLTKVYAVASGKGGVGKSSVTANLAAAFAAQGLQVGVLDADIYGFSIPGILGVKESPTRLDDMILPPLAGDIKVISIGMFVPEGQPVVWRGPMLHRALEQFLADVFWGDLDVLLLDLPPGTGDIAISVAQLIPKSELLVITTPQSTASDVAQRAGSIARQTQQEVVGVIENMAWLEQPDGSRLEIFGSGGGQKVADGLTKALHTDIPLLGQIPLDIQLREACDSGQSALDFAPESSSAAAIKEIAAKLSARKRGLAGKSLGLSVN